MVTAAEKKRMQQNEMRYDDSVPKRGRPVTGRDEVTSELLASGEATMAQIAQLFNTDAKTLPKRLRDVVHRGTRRGYKLYNIAEAAAKLVKPGYEIEEFIRQMSPQELPPLLSKEYWNGQNARMKYEKDLGNLWPTEDVVSFFGEIGNTLRMSLLLFADGVEREEGLTDGQRVIIQRMTGGAIEEIKKSIIEKFKDYHANRIEPVNALPVVAESDDDDDDDFNIRGSDQSVPDAEGDEEEDDGI